MSDRILITVSGSAGVGKDTIVQLAMPELLRLGIGWVPSVVTRAPRTTDDPSGYRHVDRDGFLRLVSDRGIMEFVEVAGEMYGTPVDALDAGPRGGIKIVTVDGVRSIWRWMIENLGDSSMLFSVYVVAPSEDVVLRLHDRGWDDDRVAERLSCDLVGYGPEDVSPDETGLWGLVLDNPSGGIDAAVDGLISFARGSLSASDRR